MQPRILYIDGCKEVHPVFTGYARQILGNVDIVSAFDGAEGIKAYLSADPIFDPIDMVVADYCVLKKNGTDVIQAIRKVDRTVSIAVMKGVGCSALEQISLKGANVMISKPFEKEQLELILRATLKP